VSAVHDTESSSSPGLVAKPETASATRAGVIDGDAAEAGPTPAALIAATVSVYEVPLVSPVIVQGLDVAQSGFVTDPPELVATT
jgi:hypothetical protein